MSKVLNLSNQWALQIEIQRMIIFIDTIDLIGLKLRWIMCTCSMTKAEIRRNMSRTSIKERSTFSSSECLTSNSRSLLRSDSAFSSSWKYKDAFSISVNKSNGRELKVFYISDKYWCSVVRNERFGLLLRYVCVNWNRINKHKLIQHFVSQSDTDLMRFQLFIASYNYQFLHDVESISSLVPHNQTEIARVASKPQWIPHEPNKNVIASLEL